MKMTIIEIGARIKIAGGLIDAQVTAACIRSSRVTYECVWWDGNTRKCEWLDAVELSATEQTNIVKIGFSRSNR